MKRQMPPELSGRNDISRQERSAHLPVLLDEVLTWLAPKPAGQYCDGTVGLGGHARAVLTERFPDGGELDVPMRTWCWRAERVTRPRA